MKRPPGNLTRDEVAERLGCSVSTVQRFEREGLIVPTRQGTGTKTRLWFKTEDVAKLSKVWQPARGQRLHTDNKIAALNMRGKVAAVALPMFEEHRSQCGVHLGAPLLAAVCAATEADPFIVQQLYQAWKLGLEGAIAEKKRLQDEEDDRKRQRAHDAETRQKRWIEGQIKVAQINASAAGRKTG